jgi:hypothetical protein
MFSLHSGSGCEMAKGRKPLEFSSRGEIRGLRLVDLKQGEAMSGKNRERLGVALVIGVSLAFALWIEAGRHVRVGLPGGATTSRPAVESDDAGQDAAPAVEVAGIARGADHH